MADLKKLLAAAGKEWGKAKKRVATSERASFEFNDGVYVAKLTGADMGESNSGKLQTVFSWKIMEGDDAGRVKKDFQGMSSEDNMYYFGQRIEDLGFELPDSLEDVPAVLKAIVAEKLVCRIALRTKSGSDFQNVYVKKVLSGDDDEDVTDEEDTEEEAEVEELDDADAEEEGEEEEEEAEEEAEEEEEEAEGEEDEAEEADDEEGEEVTLEPGMAVIAETAKGREPGTVVQILEDKVRVKLDKDGKIVKVDPSKLELPDEEEEVEEEPVKPAKKAAPAPVPAKKAAPAPVPAKKAAPAPAKKAAPVPTKKKR